MIFLLKGAKPEKYADRRHHTGEVARPIEDIDRDIIRLVGEFAPEAAEALARALGGESEDEDEKLH